MRFRNIATCLAAFPSLHGSCLAAAQEPILVLQRAAIPVILDCISNFRRNLISLGSYNRALHGNVLLNAFAFNAAALKF